MVFLGAGCYEAILTIRGIIKKLSNHCWAAEGICMATRKRLSPATEAEVLSLSRRRCCICFGLHRDVLIKQGQIAHLDKDPSNDALDNLAFLCLPHHDQYDSKTSQSKNFALSEVKLYRRELYDQLLPSLDARAAMAPAAVSPSPGTATRLPSAGKHDLHTVSIEVLSDISGALSSISALAAKLRVSQQTAKKILMELADQGVVRVDRSKGSVKCRYSLANSVENRMIDTFVAQLGNSVASDDRFLRQRHAHEIDALIRTEGGQTYAVDTMTARASLRRSDVLASANRLGKATQAMALSGVVGVILIGITGNTDSHGDELKDLEQSDLWIRYVELE
jgi:hypothetical protein